MRKASTPRLAASALFVLALSLETAAAQKSEDDLEKLRGEIAETEERERAYQKEVGELGEETKSLRRRLVAVTARVLEKERAVGEAEDELDNLERKEAEAEGAFEKRARPWLKPSRPCKSSRRIHLPPCW